ncbi:MAG: hypothetical protein EOM20_05940 [Spartobacteria bacterium]|nr:hypothetical protein [Spartobacteria bacterium]
MAVVEARPMPEADMRVKHALGTGVFSYGEKGSLSSLQAVVSAGLRASRKLRDLFPSPHLCDKINERRGAETQRRDEVPIFGIFSAFFAEIGCFFQFSAQNRRGWPYEAG